MHSFRERSAIRDKNHLYFDGEGGEWFAIDTILDMRTVGRGRGRAVTQYLVKWKGYGDEHNMWCDADGVTQSAVDDYMTRRITVLSRCCTASGLCHHLPWFD